MENIDDRIFFSEEFSPTTTSTTTKKIFKQASVVPEKKKWALFEFFRIMNIGIKDVEMQPSDMRKYEIWTLNIKSGTIALLICSILMYTVLTSSLGSQAYNPDESSKKTYLDNVIDYFTENEEVANTAPPAKATVVVIKDTLVPMDSIQYLIYQNDSLLQEMKKQ
jgi:hypothetical protein